MRLARYLRLITVLSTTSISAQIEYRANFVINLITSLINAAGTLLILLILTGNGQPIGGWSYYEAMVVVGTFTLAQGYIGAFLQPNLNRISEYVWTGSLDLTLTKPIDSQFFVSTRDVNLVRVVDMAVGVSLIVWATSRAGHVTLSGVALGLVLFGAGCVIVYSIWLMLMATAFWFIKIGNITELFNGVFRAGQFPITAFPKWIKFFLTFIIPVAFVTTVPAEALVGRINAETVLASAVVTVALLFAARLVWLYAVTMYTSASS